MEEGSEQAELFVSLKGTLNINYNFLTPRFIVRNKFLLYGVNSTVEKNRSCGDIATNYWLLEEEDSSYVGIARVYQNYLVAKGGLQKTTDGNYSVLLEVIMSETVPALIGTKNITLTSLDALKNVLQELKELKVENTLLVLKGWNKKGLSGATPYNLKFNKSRVEIDFRNSYPNIRPAFIFTTIIRWHTTKESLPDAPMSQEQFRD